MASFHRIGCMLLLVAVVLAVILQPTSAKKKKVIVKVPAKIKHVYHHHTKKVHIHKPKPTHQVDQVHVVHSPIKGSKGWKGKGYSGGGSKGYSGGGGKGWSSGGKGYGGGKGYSGGGWSGGKGWSGGGGGGKWAASSGEGKWGGTWEDDYAYEDEDAHGGYSSSSAWQHHEWPSDHKHGGGWSDHDSYGDEEGYEMPVSRPKGKKKPKGVGWKIKVNHGGPKGHKSHKAPPPPPPPPPSRPKKMKGYLVEEKGYWNEDDTRYEGSHMWPEMKEHHSWHQPRPARDPWPESTTRVVSHKPKPKPRPADTVSLTHDSSSWPGSRPIRPSPFRQQQTSSSYQVEVHQDHDLPEHQYDSYYP